MGNGVLHRHALKVVNLAARQDGGQDLVLLCGGEDEDHMGWRLLKRLQEGVEGCRRQHVNLVDDEHLVASHLRRYARLLHESLDVLHRVVAGGVELKDVKRALLVERLAALTLVACFALCRGVHAVDGLCKNAGTRCLAHSARATEQIGVRKLAALHRVLQRGGERVLSHHRVEGHGAVLACRHYVVFHFILRVCCY